MNLFFKIFYFLFSSIFFPPAFFGDSEPATGLVLIFARLLTPSSLPMSPTQNQTFLPKLPVTSTSNRKNWYFGGYLGGSDG